MIWPKGSAMNATNSRRLRGRGFTLVELLVVIGIIAIMISILLPSLKRAKDSANALKCMVGIKTIMTALSMYTSDYKGGVPQFWIVGQTWQPNDPNPVAFYQSDLGYGVMRFDKGVL